MDFGKRNTRNVAFLLLILLAGIGFRLAVFSMTSRVANSGYSSYMKSSLNYADNASKIKAGEGQWRDGSELFQELYSLDGRGMSFKELWRQLEKSNHPPLYYLVLHMVIALSEGKEASLQLGFFVNLVISCFTILFVFLLGVNLFRDSRLALFSAFLCAASFLSMEVYVLHKAYELQVCLIILIFLIVFRIFDQERPGIKDFGLYGLACTLAFLAHYYSYLYIAGICLMIFIHYTWTDRNMKRIVQFAISTLLSVAFAWMVYPAAVRDLILDFRSREIQEKIAEPGNLFLPKIHGGLLLFLRWFMTKPFSLIIISTVLLLILGLILRKYRAEPGKLLENRKYFYLVSYFVIAYVPMLYISPFNNLRYTAPLLVLFIILLAGLLISYPRRLRKAFIGFFVLHSLLFNTFCLTRIARHEISGGYLIRSWRTDSVLERAGKDTGVIVVSTKPREKLRALFFHASPRDFAYCAMRIPDALFDRKGELLVFIDRKIPSPDFENCLNLVEARGFERYSSYTGFRVYRRRASASSPEKKSIDILSPVQGGS